MTVRQPSLETLARHRRPIVALFWASFYSGPVLFALAVVVRRRSHSRALRWIV